MVACATREINQNMEEDDQDIPIKVLSGTQNERYAQRDDEVQTIQLGAVPLVLGAVQTSICTVPAQ